MLVVVGLASCSTDDNPQPSPTGGSMAAAPYLFSWGEPPDPVEVMRATGVTWFTLAHILSGGGCDPAWDGVRPLAGGTDESLISRIRAAGGDVIVSFGGWSGDMLAPHCSSPQSLAAVYQQVIDAYSLRVIDIDIENASEFEDPAVQDRVLEALKLVKANNPGLTTIVTFPTDATGPNSWGQRLIDRSAVLEAGIDVFTIMPFNVGGHEDMYEAMVAATEGLRASLASAYGWSDAVAYQHMGVSGMNGLTDTEELVSPETWTRFRDWAAQRHLARFSFWGVNRDRPCPGGGVQPGCSGIDQVSWEFTRITVGYLAASA